jgi:hypothetical protein
LGLLPLSVKLTANRGNTGYIFASTVLSTSLPTVPVSYRGGTPGDILPSFKAPTDKKYGQGSRNKEFLQAKINDNNTKVDIPEDPPGAAFIQVNRYNV